ncbi:hypothetical protein HDU67_004640, partial [Dinochytrium kinnereticum]
MKEAESRATAALWKPAIPVSRSYKRAGPAFELLEVREPRNPTPTTPFTHKPNPSCASSAPGKDWSISRIRASPIVTLVLRTAVVSRSLGSVSVSEITSRAGGGAEAATLGIDLRGHIRASELLEIVDILTGGAADFFPLSQGRQIAEDSQSVPSAKPKPSFLSGCIYEIRRQVSAFTSLVSSSPSPVGRDSLSTIVEDVPSVVKNFPSDSVLPVNGDANEEVSAAISLLGLVGSSNVIGIESFALRIIADVTFANAREEIVIAILKRSGAVPPECEGVWIPVEVARRIAGKHASHPLLSSIFNVQIEKRSIPPSLSLLPPPTPTPPVSRGKRRGSNTSNNEKEGQGFLIFESDGEDGDADEVGGDTDLTPPERSQSSLDQLPVLIDASKLSLIPPTSTTQPEKAAPIWMTSMENVYV